LQPALVSAQAADPRLGTWTLTSAQSTLEPANKLSVTHDADIIHIVMSGETHMDFSLNEKSKSSPAPGNLGFNQVELHRISKKEAEVREKKDDAPVSTVREKLSADGSELTTTTTATGKPPVVTIWTRAGGTKDPKDPFAGDWTQDMSKSRMKQSPVLKFEAANGGVRFTGDFTYTARFDGKPYDVKGSRNDTVTLQLVDPHTVDAVYKRDNQVTQKDHWVLSADGTQLTVNTTGTYETGQRATEKLVFKKQ
jgi:hypothetical protein